MLTHYREKRTVNISRLSNKQLYRALSLFTREQVRELARSCNIPLGANKECTLYNLTVFRHKLKGFKIEVDLTKD